MTSLSGTFITIGRALGIGKLKLYGFHRPIGLVRQSIAEGGPVEQWRTERGRIEMLQAARGLPPLRLVEDTRRARVHFLSGRRFWHQTVFCFASLQIQSPFRITPVIFDDGSLDQDVRGCILRVIPWVEFVTHDEIKARLDDFLPGHRFPSLRARRKEYAHLRKLTDLHVGQTDWGLVLDSDMLFFRSPEDVLSWFDLPRALFMQDIDDAYGYPPALMSHLAGGEVLHKVNVGLYAIDRAQIDWDQVEHWCRTQIEEAGPSYLQEQALTALILSRQAAVPLAAHDYALLPDRTEGAEPTAILHHYVAHSKRSYFQHGWRRILADVERLAADDFRTRDSV